MTTSTRVPAVFIGHGSPMNTLDDNRYTAAWRAFGASVERPRAVLVVSAHWYTNATAVTAMAHPRTIHDFYGFPEELLGRAGDELHLRGEPLATARHDKARLELLGSRLQWATIAWNSVEVFVTIGLGIAAGSLALVAFGLDSLVEVFASLVVIWHMNPGADGHHTRRDRRAMRLVGAAFALLATYLVAAGVRQLVLGEQPDSSPAGIAYLFVTAIVMFSLARWKRRVGTALDSRPFRVEAAMTFLDGCLATSILVALALNLGLGWWWADPAAALLIGAVAAREARESWPVETAAGESSTA